MISEKMTPAQLKLLADMEETETDRWMECSASELKTALSLWKRGYLDEPETTESELFEVRRGPKLRHKGLSANRLSTNSDEQAYADAWTEQAENILGKLLYGDDKHRRNVTLREAQVAATVIQWLGSQIGQGFIEQVQTKIKTNETAAQNQ